MDCSDKIKSLLEIAANNDGAGAVIAAMESLYAQGYERDLVDDIGEGILREVTGARYE